MCMVCSLETSGAEAPTGETFRSSRSRFKTFPLTLNFDLQLHQFPIIFSATAGPAGDDYLAPLPSVSISSAGIGSKITTSLLS